MASRSLGTLTLDLIAKTSGFIQGMDKASRETEKWRKKVKKELEKVANVAKVAGAATVAGITALTVQTVRAAQEISQLSAVAGESTADFQRYAAGAQFLGVEQDKLADIFKDSRDKLGDFLAEGAGPLSSFFTDVASKVGVTADEFQNLTGSQILGKYVDTLEKANVSQNEMVFYLEAIASDATMLLPLLENGGEGFRMLGEEAEKAGAILDGDTLTAAQEISAAMFLFEQSSTGARNVVAGELLPTLADLGGAFSEVAADGKTFETVGRAINVVLKGALTVATGVAAAFDLLGSYIGGFVAVALQVPNGLSAVQTALSEVGADLDDTAQGYADAIDKILNAGEGDGAGGQSAAEKKVESLAKLLDSANKKRANLNNTPIKPVVDKESVDRVAKTLEGLEMQVAVLGKSKVATELFKLEAEGATQAQLDLAESLLVSIDAFENQQKAAEKAREEQAKVNEEARSIADSLLTEEEQIEKSYERRRKIVLDNTAVTGEAQKELLTKLENDKNAQLKAIEDARQEQQLAATQSLFGNLSGLAKTFAGENSAIYKGMFAVEKAIGIARSIVAIQTGIAQASAQPFPANLGAIASVVAATSNIIATIEGVQVQGVAHDGLDSVPKTGTYLLEKGERVTTEKTSAKLDRKLDMASGMGGGQPQNVRINNVIDPGFVGDYMSGDAGDRIIDNWISKNQTKIQQVAGGGR